MNSRGEQRERSLASVVCPASKERKRPLSRVASFSYTKGPKDWPADRVKGGQRGCIDAVGGMLK
jgi:hypothetical protein